VSGPTVTLAGVTKSYGALKAVADVDLTLQPGERIALVGHNGAGKSTLIKLMLGLVRPTAGRVALMGENPARGAARAKFSVGYLPENLVLPPAMTGAELMNFYARLKRRPVAENGAILERVGIAEAAGRRIYTYSKGMRQRIGLAQALIGKPRVLLLDEPTSGLDPALRHRFYEIMGELAAGGATVLISSHALAELESQADRVVVMNRGRKVADGSITELRRLSAHPVRIRVTMANGAAAAFPDNLAPSTDWTRINDRVVEIRCAGTAKVETLRRLAASTVPLEDIEIAETTLDDIYAHFLRRDGRPEAAE
jgi:Cu-processing system ATP-binding protein